MNNSLATALLELRRDILKPTSKMNLVEWSDNYRFLSPESSSQPGKWNTDFVEVARGPMLAITEPGVTKITVMGPTQLLKTELLNNVVGYFISQDPAPIIVMQPIEKLADTWSTDRLGPMVRDTPILKDLISDSRDSGNTKLHKVFPGGHLTVVSAGSPSDVASRPVRVVLMDEIDKYKSSGNEGDAEKLIEQRTETFWNALSIAVCSPTNEGTSKIASRFEDSDQRYFHSLCPHCNNYEKLEWSQVKWNEKDASTAHYECSHCQQAWTEPQRIESVSNGIYIATKPFKGHAGFTCNAIASPWQPLSRLVEKFLDAKSDPEKLKVFVNTSLAQTWKQKAETPDHERLYERRSNYPIGTVPNEEIVFLTMGVDCQADRLEAHIVGWTKDKQSFSVDYRVIIGQTHTDEPWTELQKLIQSTFPVADTRREMPITWTCIDSGFNSSKVYSFVQKFSPNKVRAIKGSDSLQSSFKMGSDLQVNYDGSKNKFAHKIWIAGVSYLKTEFYSNLKLPPIEAGSVPSGYCHFPEYDMDFFLGLTAEALVMDKGKYQWVKVRTRNEQLDTFVYARCAAAMFGLDRFRQQDWEALAGMVETQEAVSGVLPKAPIPQRPIQNNPLWKNQGFKKRF